MQYESARIVATKAEKEANKSIKIDAPRTRNESVSGEDATSEQFFLTYHLPKTARYSRVLICISKTVLRDNEYGTTLLTINHIVRFFAW